MLRVLLVILTVIGNWGYAASTCRSKFGIYRSHETTLGIREIKNPRLYLKIDPIQMEMIKQSYLQVFRTKSSKVKAPESVDAFFAFLEAHLIFSGRQNVNLLEALRHSPKSVQNSLGHQIQEILNGKVLNRYETKDFFLKLYYLTHQNVFQGSWTEFVHWDQSARRLALQHMEWGNFYQAMLDIHKGFRYYNLERKSQLKRRFWIVYWQVKKYLRFGIVAPVFVFKRVREFGDMESLAPDRIQKDFNRNFLDFMKQENWAYLEWGSNFNMAANYSRKIIQYALVGSSVAMIYMYFHMNFSGPEINEDELDENEIIEELHQMELSSDAAE